MGGVKRVFRWRLQQGAVLPQVYQELTRAVEALNVSGQRASRWQAKCVAYQHAASAGLNKKDAFLVSLDSSDSRAPGVIVLRVDKQILEAECSIFDIFERSGQYQLRLAVTLDGQAFSHGDVVLRLGRASSPSGFLGIVLEIEFCPVALVELARLALDETEAAVRAATAAVVSGALERVEEPAYADFGLPLDSHTSRHSALLLVQAIRQFVAL